MIKVIRFISLVIIGFCVVKLAQSCAPDGEAQEYSCTYANEFSERYDVRAVTRDQAESMLKARDVIPYESQAVFCKLKRGGKSHE